MSESTMYVEKKDSYILIVGEGEKSYDSVMGKTRDLYTLIEKMDCHYILAGYRKAEFDLYNSETFNMVRAYEEEMPLCSKVVVATVV